MAGKLPSFFKETTGAMLNLLLTVYYLLPKDNLFSKNVFVTRHARIEKVLSEGVQL